MILPKTYKITDLFCGAGGTSTGAVEAIEMLGLHAELTAINHWPVAIATHTENHPNARHLTTSIDNINPRDLYKEGELDLLWASPECTHHSVARGGKPINDQSRATAWCVVRWAEALRPNIILIENVPEFITWGPIGSNGRPLKSKKGETFRAWMAAVESLGYKGGWTIQCAADFGDPTTRRRLFVQFVRGRRKIVWPNPTHSPKGEADLFGSRKSWVAARKIIDWSIEGKSIYERKKPLSPKTLRRIEAGLRKFGLKSHIITMEHGGAVRDIERPLPTITTARGGAMGVTEPFIMSAGGPECPARPVSEPVGTILTRDHRALVEPFLVQYNGESNAHDIDAPVPALTTEPKHYLAEPFLAKLRGTNNAADINNPCPTVTGSGGNLAVVEPYLVQVAHGNGSELNADVRRSRSVDETLPTVCGNRGEWAVCEPGLLPQQSGGAVRPVSEPAPTLSTKGAIALIEPFLIPQQSNPTPKSLDEPVPTVVAEGSGHKLVEPFLIEYYGTGGSESIDNPLPTVTGQDRFGLVRPIVVIRGERYLLDIRFRMLQPHELSAAQGFPKGYKFTGNKTQKVKQIGNAVPRNLSRALVLAAISQQSDILAYVPTEEVA